MRKPSNSEAPLYRLCADRAVNKDALARGLGIHRHHLDKIIAGRQVPRVSLALALMEALGLGLRQAEIIWPHSPK